MIREVEDALPWNPSKLSSPTVRASGAKTVNHQRCTEATAISNLLYQNHLINHLKGSRLHYLTITDCIFDRGANKFVGKPKLEPWMAMPLTV